MKGLLGLWTTNSKEKERMSECVNIIHFHPEPSQPHYPIANDFTRRKEGEDLIDFAACLAFSEHQDN
jgi:hypothetical protein